MEFRTPEGWQHCIMRYQRQILQNQLRSSGVVGSGAGSRGRAPGWGIKGRS